MADYPTLSEIAYRGIKEQIVQGEIPPLGRLVETELAAKLEISRAPVREALRRLEREGIVETVPRWGSYVRQITPDELMELWQLREVLDGLACRLLANRITPQQIAQLRDMCGVYRRHAEKSDEAGCDAADVKFHRRIAEWSGNRQLLNILDVFEVLTKSVMVFYHSREDLVSVAREHETLVDLLEQRKVKEAERWAHRHIAFVARRHHRTLRKIAESLGKGSAPPSSPYGGVLPKGKGVPRRTK